MSLHKLLIIACLSMLSEAQTTKCADYEACLSMNAFYNVYNEIQKGMISLSNQLKALEIDLTNAINNTCGKESLKLIDSHQFVLTFCDFENGMCGYVQNPGSQRTWTLEGDIDHTLGSNAGHVCANNREYSGTYTSEILSPVFEKAGAYCIRFFYKIYGNVRGTVNFRIYLKVNSGVGVPIFQTTTADPVWKLAEISPDPEYLRNPFQIVFHADGGMLYVDDIAVYNVPCSSPGIRRPISNCNDGLVWRNGTVESCMKFHYEPMTWKDAVHRCKKDWPLSHLVSIPSSAKQTLITNYIKSNTGPTQAAQYGYWTSGTDVSSEGHYVWTAFNTPLPLNYTNWHAGQPNNIGGNQDCLLIQYYNDNYTWGDVACSEKHPFICEAMFNSQHQGSTFIG